MSVHARPTLTLTRTLQTLGPVPPCVEDVCVDRPAALRGLHLGARRYRLEGLIAEGATSWVYRGRHILMDQAVAVKVLRPEYCARPDAVERFLDEARTLARLRHPNIVTVHDFDRTDAHAWMVMELLEGETLAERRARIGRLGWPSVRRIALQLCSAILVAHEHGILHRDIKPENCVCLPNAADQDFLKIVDFGIAARRVGDRIEYLEAAGCVAGTPAYMAPERMLGGGDERSDIYSTGVLMYELLTGTLPFACTFPLASRGQPEPPSIRARGCCSTEVDGIVLRAIAGEAANRFASMRELAAAVRRVGEIDLRRMVLGPPPVRRQPRPAATRTLSLDTPPEIVLPPPAAREPRRPRSRVPGLLSATAALTLALGLSPLGATSNARIEEPAPPIAASQASRTPLLEQRYSTPNSGPSFPAELTTNAHRPWRSDCSRVAGR